MSDLESLGGGLLLCIGALRRRLLQLPHVDGVTIPELQVLARLDRFGPQTGSALAKVEQISPQAVGATVTSLEGKGLVSRASDPEDGRRVVWSLSAEGREIVLRKRGVRAGQVAAALAELDPADVSALAAALPALERLLEKL
ncbi:MarR family winged helix-turn-helix transcriptional regulator [Nocardioides sp. Kera G14]|uniref:MarR family winged helix-turn-helix transcriptional regulator n=1 Tax=Nocardioides sp. Kera G14 TaxID=2884264 RepID=UPI001D0FDFEB|nr:MarR family transcriptional regulator [Nocardioides sp. Kera G14]UDY22626.1 MarR family transcriptional regulator [Nocardioides sp. Kera G14]